MKKAFGAIELLIVVVLITVLYFTCFHDKYGRKDPFDDNSVNSKIDAQIEQIEDAKALRERIESNLKEDY